MTLPSERKLAEPPRDCRRHSPLRGWGARDRAVRMVFVHGHPVGPCEQRPFGRLFYTPYWTTFELPAIDMKVASVGILDQIVTGLR
jgi:hypothetical protein